MAAIPPYIEIYNEGGARVAVLSPQADGLKDCVIDRELNGSCTLSFSLPATCPKAAYLTERCRIVAEGREFVLFDPGSITQVREGKRLWVQVQAQESWVLLGRIYKTIPADNVPLAVEILSATAAQALSALLEGTGWALGSCDVEGVHDLELEKEPVLTCIRKVAEIWGGYLIWDSLEHRVSLVKEPGQDRGYQIRYAKNLKGVTRTVDPDVITRLYPFGENDLNIATVNNGQIYLEDFSYTPEIREGIWVDQSIDDPAELKARAQEVLAKVCRPRANYRIDMVDLRTLPEHAHETFDVGDWVRVIDPELGIDAKMRVIRRKWYVFQPWRCEVEVGDVLDNTLAQHLASMRQATDFVRKVLLANPGARNLAKGFIDAFATEINTRRGKLVWSGDVLEAIEVDASGTPTGRRVRITPGGIGISIDGGQTYRTAMTGQGILADVIVVSEFYAITTEDQYTKLTGTGLEVYDSQGRLRVKIGQYQPGKFGVVVYGPDGAVWFDSEYGLRTPGLQDGAVTASKIAASAVTADKIAAGAIDGKVITGAIIQTSQQAYPKLILDSQGLRAYNAQGAITVEIKSDGSARFKGTIESGSTISGASIIGGSIYGTDIRCSNILYVGDPKAPDDKQIVFGGPGVILFENATDSIKISAMNGIILQEDVYLQGFLFDYDDGYIQIGSPVDLYGNDIYGIGWLYAAVGKFSGRIAVNDIYAYSGDAVRVNASFYVYGAVKSAVVDTSRGPQALYARESPESRFVDEGIAELRSGFARVDIDPVFLECVEPEGWLIHLTPYGQTNGLYVKEIGKDYFTVAECGGGRSNVRFAWSLSAPRKGVGALRWEPIDTKREAPKRLVKRLQNGQIQLKEVTQVTLTPRQAQQRLRMLKLERERLLERLAAIDEEIAALEAVNPSQAPSAPA
ncbi:MAG: phage tail protein [Firmicutes bacterium]|nr:phage tail protein [Bacillota bacterium]